MEIKVVCHLFELRSNRQLTIRQLADISGVSKTTINNLENDNLNATLLSVCAIAAALKVTLDELITFSIK